MFCSFGGKVQATGKHHAVDLELSFVRSHVAPKVFSYTLSHHLPQKLPRNLATCELRD